MKKFIVIEICFLLALTLLGCVSEEAVEDSHIKETVADYSNSDIIYPATASDELMPVIDTASFDIDGDGIIEDCSMTYGMTYGLFSVIIKVRDGEGNVKYSNTFVLPGGDVAFGEKDGSPQIILNGNYHKLYTEDGCIIIDELESEF